MLPGWLGRIDDGISEGIDIYDLLPKHRRIDPSTYRNQRDLLRDTAALGRGSKWLNTVSREEQFDSIRRILIEHRVQRDSPARVVRGGPFPRPVGVCDGQIVSSIEVRYASGVAHGYPCPP